MRGSFLHKNESPDVKNSLLKVAEFQSPAQAKRKLRMSVNDLKDDVSHAVNVTLDTVGDFKVGVSVGVWCTKCTLNTGVNTNFEITQFGDFWN
jgi:hypothetical protein